MSVPKALNLGLMKDRHITNIINCALVETNTCINTGVLYSGEILFAPGCPKQNIQPGSKQESMVANFRKEGCSITVTTIVINIYNFKNISPPVMKSAVWHCEQRIKTCVTPVEKRCQGSMDCKSPWTKPNYRQC